MKSKKMLCVLVVLGLVSVASAANNFTDAGADHLWTNPDNWALGVPDDSTTHPSDMDPAWQTNVGMTSDGTICVIDADVASYNLNPGCYGGDNEVQMQSGTATIGAWGLSVGRGGNKAGHAGGYGKLYVSGGTINTPWTNIPNQFTGATMVDQKGEIVMTGGVLNTGWISVGDASGYADGLLQIKDDAVVNVLNDDGVFDVADGGLVDIHGGTMNLHFVAGGEPGDKTVAEKLGEVDAMITAGDIVGYDGAGTVNTTYEAPSRTSDGEIVITAVPEPATIALLGFSGLFLSRRKRY